MKCATVECCKLDSETVLKKQVVVYFEVLSHARPRRECVPYSQITKYLEGTKWGGISALKQQVRITLAASDTSHNLRGSAQAVLGDCSTLRMAQMCNAIVGQ